MHQTITLDYKLVQKFKAIYKYLLGINPLAPYHLPFKFISSRNKMNLTPIINALAAATLALSSALSYATIVEFQTSHGNIQVNLYDESTPNTVTNFLTYVNENDYIDTVIHRVEPNFVVQGGGFTFNGDFPLDAIATRPAVINEPKWSNVKGTIAMAKVANSPNSATNQWFFNLSDNSTNLDVQNQGFTVFGQVIDEGMEVLSEIENVPLCSNVPIENYSVEQCANGDIPAYEDFVTIYNIVIIDSNANTDANLDKVPNTLVNVPTTPDTDSGGGGGSMFWLTMLAIFISSARLFRS